MSFLDLFKKKDPRNNHDLTAEDRIIAAETRQMNRKIKIEEQKMKLEEMRRDFALRQKEQELEMANIEADLQEIMGPEDTQGGIEQMLMPYLINMIPKPQAPQNTLNAASGDMTQMQSQTVNPSAPALRELNDDELNDMWKKTPMMAKQYVKTVDDDTVLLQLKRMLPNCSEDTYLRAFKIVRGLKE